MLKALDKFLDWCVNVMMVLACVCGVAMMAHTTLDVVFRNLLNSPIPGTLETVSAYYMVAIAFFPLAYIVRGEGHIFVDLFVRLLRRPTRRRLDIAVHLIAFVYAVIFAWMTGKAAIGKTELGEVWETANGFMVVWPSRWFLPVSLALMAVYTLKVAIADIAAYRSETDSNPA